MPATDHELRMPVLRGDPRAQGARETLQADFVTVAWTRSTAERGTTGDGPADAEFAGSCWTRSQTAAVAIGSTATAATNPSPADSRD